MVVKCSTLHMLLSKGTVSSRRAAIAALRPAVHPMLGPNMPKPDPQTPDPSDGAARPARSAVLNINDFANRQTSDEEPYDQYEVSVPLQSAGACLKQARM